MGIIFWQRDKDREGLSSAVQKFYSPTQGANVTHVPVRCGAKTWHTLRTVPKATQHGSGPFLTACKHYAIFSKGAKKSG
jgi:hypothetical protein